MCNLPVDDYGSRDPKWLSLDWSKHLRSIELDERSVNYVDVQLGEPKGPPLLFLHGLGGCWQNWLETIPYFAPTRRAVALDLPGFGGSQMPAETITIHGYCMQVDRFCGILGLDEVEIVGNSMGGLIAAGVAIDFPERIRSLTLVSAAGMYATALGRLPRVPGHTLARLFGGYAKVNRREIVTRPRLRRMALQGVVHYPNRLNDALVYELLSGAGAPGFMDALNAVLSHDLRAKLHLISAPTLIVWGRNDRIVPCRSAKRFERCIPHSKVVIMPQTGHVPQIERPAKFNRIYEEFLASPYSTAGLAAQRSRENARKRRIGGGRRTGAWRAPEAAGKGRDEPS